MSSYKSLSKKNKTFSLYFNRIDISLQNKFFLQTQILIRLFIVKYYEFKFDAKILNKEKY